MGENADEQEFADIKRGGFGSNVAVVDDAAAHYGDAHAVPIIVFWAELAHHLCDGDSFAAIVWDVVKMDDAEGVGAFDALDGSSWYFSYALAQVD